MKVYCDIHNLNIERFDFEHKGYRLRFRQYNANVYDEERRHLDSNDIPKVEIVFNDTQEIENLINMLNDFKIACLRADGSWCREPLKKETVLCSNCKHINEKGFERACMLCDSPNYIYFESKEEAK